MIDFDGIRKEVAIEHNLLLEKDDPALLIVTMSERVFEKYVEILLEKQMEHMQALEVAQQKGIADAKLTAGRVITEATNYASEQINTAVTAALEEGREQIRNDLRQARNEVESARKASAKWAAVSSLCAVITVGTVLINVF